MTIPTSLRRAGALLAILLAACVGGSKDTGKDQYVGDADTGAASPATTPTPDNPGAPDSTSGMSQRVPSPGAAGTRQGTSGDSGIRSTSPASTTPGVGNQTPKRP